MSAKTILATFVITLALLVPQLRAQDAPNPVVPGVVSAPVPDDAFKAQLRQALKDNPNLILDVLRDNNLELFNIVLKGQESKRDEAAKDKRSGELKNPFKPAIDPKRPMRGPAGAPITIVAYSDFECPYCAKGAKVIQELQKKYPKTIRYVFKHFPLQNHRMAVPAAAYFEAVAMQDQAKAWKFYDAVYSRQDELERGPSLLQEIAAKVGADMDKINKALENDSVIKRIREDYDEARRFDIDAIPVYLVNGVSISGASPIEEFEKVICLVQKGEANCP